MGRTYENFVPYVCGKTSVRTIFSSVRTGSPDTFVERLFSPLTEIYSRQQAGLSFLKRVAIAFLVKSVRDAGCR